MSCWAKVYKCLLLLMYVCMYVRPYVCIIYNKRKNYKKIYLRKFNGTTTTIVFWISHSKFCSSPSKKILWCLDQINIHIYFSIFLFLLFLRFVRNAFFVDVLVIFFSFEYFISRTKEKKQTLSILLELYVFCCCCCCFQVGICICRGTYYNILFFFVVLNMADFSLVCYYSLIINY